MTADERAAANQTLPNGDGKDEINGQESRATVMNANLENGAEEENDDLNVGTVFKVMRLWEDKSIPDRLVWLTEPPKEDVDDTPVEESPQYAITLLHRPSKETGKHRLDAIIMRGPELRQVLEETIPNVSSLYNETEQGILVRAPFRLLFWHLDQIDSTAENAKGKPRDVLHLLQDVLHAEFRDVLAKRKEMVAKQEINFDIAWTLFKPGITCLTDYANSYIATKVKSIGYSKDPMGHIYYRINYQVLAWDGEHLGWQDSYADVMEFPGRRKIQSLDIYPVEFHNDADFVTRLPMRGRQFVELVVQEPHLMSFNGETIDREASPMWWQAERKKTMSERVVLDARAYSHYFRRLTKAVGRKRDELNRKLSKSASETSDFMYCRPEFHCYALQHKKWARVWIDDLEQVSFNESAYPSLVLPNDYKDLLLAFAEAQMDEYGFDDVIAGKGQGILMLLAGPPGTGKTLTAEAIAEHMKRPLYSVSAGELGAAAGGMEGELNRVLELSTRWNAVLLLDEADVFLERRTDNDLQRNSIVSIFLRRLEYYRGIMFLTTNRFGSFDEAFKSRIHITIHYPDLDTSARRVVWDNFLNKARQIGQYGVDVSAEDVEQLALKTLNGREIRNIVKSAQLLASRSKQPLQRRHLDVVWKVEHKDSVWSDLDDSKTA